jgi:hypothetical protein
MEALERVYALSESRLRRVEREARAALDRSSAR